MPTTQDLLRRFRWSLGTRRGRIAWTLIALLAVAALVAQLHYIPIAWDVVTHAQSYSETYVRAYGWSQGQYLSFIAPIYLENAGFLLAIALFPVCLSLVVLKTAKLEAEE